MLTCSEQMSLVEALAGIILPEAPALLGKADLTCPLAAARPLITL